MKNWRSFTWLKETLQYVSKRSVYKSKCLVAEAGLVYVCRLSECVACCWKPSFHGCDSSGQNKLQKQATARSVAVSTCTACLARVCMLACCSSITYYRFLLQSSLVPQGLARNLLDKRQKQQNIHPQQCLWHYRCNRYQELACQGFALHSRTVCASQDLLYYPWAHTVVGKINSWSNSAASSQMPQHYEL